MDRRALGSWLSGPSAAGGVDLGYPGKRLGLPESDRGSVARPGRRLAAVLVDWLACLAVTGGLLRVASPWATLAVFWVENLVLVATLGFTFGHRLLGMRVTRLDGSPPGVLAALLRSVLLCLAVPAFVWDRDQRGLHDRLPGTVLVRS